MNATLLSNHRVRPSGKMPPATRLSATFNIIAHFTFLNTNNLYCPLWSRRLRQRNRPTGFGAHISAEASRRHSPTVRLPILRLLCGILERACAMHLYFRLLSPLRRPVAPGTESLKSSLALALFTIILRPCCVTAGAKNVFLYS